MDKEKIKKFDKEQLELLLNDLQDIDKFTGFKDGAFKYELGKYQASLLINYIQKQKEIIDKAVEYINSSDISIDIRKTDGSLNYVGTDELLDILKEVSE